MPLLGFTELELDLIKLFQALQSLIERQENHSHLPTSLLKMNLPEDNFHVYNHVYN